MQVNPAVALLQVAKFPPQVTQALLALLKKYPVAHWVAKTLLPVGLFTPNGQLTTLVAQAIQEAVLVK